jgi:predicted permease
MSVWRFWRRKAEDRELQEEMEAHIAHEVEENTERGMTAEEARRRALVKFGSRETVREDLWRWNTIGVLEGLLRDLRHVLRALRRTPGFALAVTVVMALGIGAVTTMFTIVRSVLLKPLPFGDEKRLVMLYEQTNDGKTSYNWVAGGIFEAWQQQTKSFEHMALFQEDEYGVSGAGGQLPERMLVAVCSWRFFPLLGVEPAFGRVFDGADDRSEASATVILSWSLWKRRFGGQPGIVGQTIQLEAKPYTVIGVMPAQFSYPDAHVQAWLPAYHEVGPMTMGARDDHQFRVIATMKPGILASAGLSEADAIVKRIHDEHPAESVGRGANIRPLMEAVVGDYKTPLYVLLAATGCVLVIACLNAANLFVARFATRRRETAIRSALGGGRWRLAWEQTLESLVLSVGGGIVGLALAWSAVQWVARTRQDMTRAEAIAIDGAVLGFAVAVMMLSGLFAGVLAAVASRNEKVLETLQESSRTHSGGRGKAQLGRGLLAAEMALTVVLLVAAGLLLKSYDGLKSTKLGCATENVLTMHLALPEQHYERAEQRVSFFERLIGEVRALPGVERAGLVTRVPGGGYGGDNIFTIPEHPPLAKGEFQDALRRYAEPGYFEAMQIPLLKGRTYREGERLENAKVVIVNDLLAKRYFAGEEPIGRHIRVNLNGKGIKDYEIIGVVGDTKHLVADAAQPMAYYPLYGGLPSVAFIVVRAKQDAASLALPVQKLIAQMDADLAVSDVLTMEQVVGKATTSASFNAELTLSFAVLSLVLAAVGLYGVLAYVVAQRSSEIGVRMALGAKRGQVLRLMLADGMRPVVMGLVVGLAGAVAAAQMIRELLYGVKPMDAGVFAGVAVILLSVAGIACVVPVWKASKLDPARTLRME